MNRRPERFGDLLPGVLADLAATHPPVPGAAGTQERTTGMNPSEFMSTVYPLVGVGASLVARKAEDVPRTALLVAAGLWLLGMWVRGASERRGKEFNRDEDGVK